MLPKQRMIQISIETQRKLRMHVDFEGVNVKC
jgi:hypothetical protein